MKARIKFSKCGSMRFIGHLDVMRYFQKAFRRAHIQVSYSQGFSPHQLMSFSSPLGIGLSSDAEYMDLTLDASDAKEVMLQKMNEQMNDEITVKDFTLLKDDAKPSMAMLSACDYVIALKQGKETFLSKYDLKREIKEFMAQDVIEIVKKTKRSEKLVDIKPNIYCMTDSLEEFEKYTKADYHSDTCLFPEYYEPLLYVQATAGSVTNIKPELILEAFAGYLGEEMDLLSYQIHRLEMYGDLNGKKGEVHTKISEIPCDLAPLSVYDQLEENH